MRCLIVHEDVLYEWVPWPGNICLGNCDIPNCSSQRSVNKLCKRLREIVGDSMTHRFKEVKADNEWRETH